MTDLKGKSCNGKWFPSEAEVLRDGRRFLNMSSADCEQQRKESVEYVTSILGSVFVAVVRRPFNDEAIALAITETFVVFDSLICLCLAELCSECSPQEKNHKELMFYARNPSMKRCREWAREVLQLTPCTNKSLLCLESRTFRHHVGNQLNTNNKSVKTFNTAGERMEDIPSEILTQESLRRVSIGRKENLWPHCSRLSM